MVFRDVLFKIPKKYLVVIIVFLTMFILKSNVFAYSDYDLIPTDSPAVDCIFYSKVRLPQNVYFDLRLEQTPSFRYQEGGLDNNYWFQIMTYPRNFSSGYYDDYIILQEPEELFKLEINSNYGGGRAGLALSLGADYNNLMVNPFGQQWGTDLAQMNTITFRLMTYTNELSGNLSNFVVQQGDNVINSGNLIFGDNSFNYDGLSPLVIGGGGQYGYFYNWKGGISNSDDSVRTGLFNYYPCKMIDTSNGSIEYIPGAYDIVNGTFVYFDDFIFDDNDLLSEPPQEIQDYTPPATPTPTPEPTPNYSGALSDINNSINATNNFLTDESASDNLVNINSPSISNSEIAGDVDNAFNSFITGWANLLDSTSPVSVDIYIPNYINNSGTKFITIHGDMIKNFLSTTSLIPGVNLNLLVVVQTLWTVLFAWFFYLIIISFVNGIYSGEFFKDEKLKELTGEYTGVMRNML